jgi:hypothetical protein
VNLEDTLLGLGAAASAARAELERIDRVVQEVNAKIETSGATPPGLRAEWRPAYRAWGDFAARSELLSSPDPRLTAEGTRRELAAAVPLRNRALELYRRWKAVAGSAAANSSMGAAPAPEKKSLMDHGLVRGGLCVAALLGGAAALCALYETFKKKREEAQPATPFNPYVIGGPPPALPAMPAFGQVAVPVSVPIPMPRWPRYPRPRPIVVEDDGGDE